MNRFQFGICEWCLPPIGPSVCRLAAEYGLNGIALDFGSLNEGLRLADPRIRDWYAEEAKRTGVSFCALALNVLASFDMLHKGIPEVEATIGHIFSEAVIAARELQIPVIQVPSFNENAMTDRSHMEVMAERFRDLCNRASGIVVGTENTLSAEDNKSLLRMVDRENFQVYFDTENPAGFGFGESPELLKALEGLICQIHVKDGDGQRMSMTTLGKGHGRFAECAEIIMRSGYSGWIVLENEFKAYGRDNDLLLKEDIWTMRRAFSQKQ